MVPIAVGEVLQVASATSTISSSGGTVFIDFPPEVTKAYIFSESSFGAAGDIKVLEQPIKDKFIIITIPSVTPVEMEFAAGATLAISNVSVGPNDFRLGIVGV